jgi:hypothetical protein
MEQELEAELDRMRRLPMAQLRQRYGERFPEEFGTTHRLCLIKRIAWRLQASVYGGLSEEALSRAREIVDETELNGKSTSLPCRNPAINSVVAGSQLWRRRDLRTPPLGTELSRTYRDRTITVTVATNGFNYEGHIYRSLSAVARAATGTQWNGLIFFGLAKRRGKAAKAKKTVLRKIRNAA